MTRLVSVSGALLVVLAGCQASARRRADGDIVQSVRFAGTSRQPGQSDIKLKAVMELGDSPFGVGVWPLKYWATPSVYDPKVLKRDAYRLEVWYAHNGWLDAEVRGWTVRAMKRARGRKAAMLSVVGHVEPGEPSVVGDFEFDWLGIKSAQVNILEGLTRRTGYVQPGAQFSLDNVGYTSNELLARLQNQSFAYATVESSMDAYPSEHRVDVKLSIDAGPAASIGPIEVVGEDHVDERDVLARLPFTEGDPYKLNFLQDAQRRVFRMGVFNTVNIRPDLSDRSNSAVPVSVSVIEAPPRRWRAGGGMTFDGAVITPRVRASFEHINVFRELVRFGLEVSGGAAVPIASAKSAQLLLSAHSQTRWPVSPKVELYGDADFNQDLLAGQLPFTTAGTGVRAQWSFVDQWRDQRKLSFGPDVHYIALEPSEELSNLISATFGTGSPTSYVLATVNADLTVDWRDPDSILKPRSGSLWTVGLRQSIPFGAQPILFTEGSAEGRLYRRINFKRRPRDIPWSAALLGRTQVLVPWNQSATVPYSERLFLGGGSNLRGFRRDFVGAYDCVCLAQDTRTGTEYKRRYVPHGGLVSALTAAELRYDWGSFTFLGFAEAGLLADGWQDIGLDRLRVDVGVGGRLDTVVGPIRLDLAFRPPYPEDDGPDLTGSDSDRGIYLGCEEAGPAVRPYDLRSTFARAAREEGSLRGPAFQLFIGIGDAF